MILSDFQCSQCSHVAEHLVNSDDKTVVCPRCGGEAKRIITLGGVFLGNQDAAWVRDSAKHLLDMEIAVNSKDPLERKLAREPNRETLFAYMKQKGVRFFENEKGAPPVHKRPPGVDMNRINKEVFERRRRRDRIEL